MKGNGEAVDLEEKGGGGGLGGREEGEVVFRMYCMKGE